MRTLVTGADGYVGAVLVPLLRERGHDVTGLDAGFYRDGWLYGRAPLPASLTRDIRSITEADVQGFDAVVHLAELSNDPLSQHDPAVTYDINYRGSSSLARTCKAAGVQRFVYSSSCSVYGTPSPEPKTEVSTPDPQTAYARCKVLVEQALHELADDQFCPVILRNATAYGASPRMRFDIVLNDLAGRAFTAREIRMVSDGTPWRPLVHVRDICRAMVCALEAPRRAVHDQVFNVGADGENYRVREIAAIVNQVFPACAVSFGAPSADTRSYRVSFAKIKAGLPGFECRFDAARGALELGELFRKLPLTRELFEFRAFTRLRQLRHLIDTGQIDATLHWTERTDRPRPVAA